MTLKDQLIELFREDDCIYTGAEVERMVFYTRNGGIYKAGTIGRELRLLSEENGDRPRLLKSMKTGTIRYKYNPSAAELFDKQFK